jgi:hypothetical protein
VDVNLWVGQPMTGTIWVPAPHSPSRAAAMPPRPACCSARRVRRLLEPKLCRHRKPLQTQTSCHSGFKHLTQILGQMQEEVR